MKYKKYLPYIFIIFLVNCSKFQFYNWVKEWQQDEANLIIKKIEISAGNIVFLDKKNANQEQEVILMIHGFGASKETFVLFAAEMDKIYRIIIPRPTRHGESSQPNSLNYSIQNQVEWLKEFIEKVKINKKFHIVGNSMGGAIAIRFSYLYPEKIKSLTLIDSAGAAVTKSEFYYLLVSGENALIVKNTKDFVRLLDFSMEKRPYIPSPILDVLAEQKTARKDLDAKIFQDIIVDIDQIPVLQEIKIPTLILWGKKDKVIHIDSARFFQHKINNSQLVIFENIGHIPMLENPKETSEAFKNFLKETLK